MTDPVDVLTAALHQTACVPANVPHVVEPFPCFLHAAEMLAAMPQLAADLALAAAVRALPTDRAWDLDSEPSLPASFRHTAIIHDGPSMHDTRNGRGDTLTAAITAALEAPSDD